MEVQRDVEASETAPVQQWCRDRLAEGVQPHEIGLFVHSAIQLATSAGLGRRSTLGRALSRWHGRPASSHRVTQHRTTDRGGLIYLH